MRATLLPGNIALPPGDQSRTLESVRPMGLEILALLISSCEILGKTLSSVCCGEKPQASTESHPSLLHSFR